MPEEVAQAAGPEVDTPSDGVPSQSAQNPSQEFGESQGEGSLGQGDKDKGPGPKLKAKSRYARAREWRQALEQREAHLAQREQAWEQREAQAKKPGYTLEELRHCRAQWAQEAEYDQAKADLVAKADVQIAKMEAEEKRDAGSQAFMAQWHQAEATLQKEDPDFMKQGSPLDKKIREILGGADGVHYRRYPLGIVAVYDRAKKELLEEELGGLRTKVSKFETENKRLNGLTSIGGGSPGQFSANGGGSYTPEQFSKLSAKQMKDYLLRDTGRSR